MGDNRVILQDDQMSTSIKVQAERGPRAGDPKHMRHLWLRLFFDGVEEIHCRALTGLCFQVDALAEVVAHEERT